MQGGHNQWRQNLNDRMHRRGILHWEKLIWHSTAPVDSQLECWMTTWRNPSVRVTGTVLSRMRENPDIIPLKSIPSHEGIWPRHLIRSSFGPLESTFQMASWWVQPFFQSSRLLQTDRPCYSVCSNMPHLDSAAMWPNNNKSYINNLKYNVDML